MLGGHTPVMVHEVMESLKPVAGKRYLDGTLGGGGHAEKLLEASAPMGQVLGLDWDETAISISRERLTRFGDRLVIRRANFADARAILKNLGWDTVHGAVLDLGFSSLQMMDPERGFSFTADQRLDMRMDRRQPQTAYQVVNTFPVHELQEIFRAYGEQPQARKVALAIDRERRKAAIETTGQLAAIVARTVPSSRRKIHPATQVFQALRIFLNRELKNLELLLEDGYDLLEPQGRMAIISFHSLEDRLVKRAFAQWSKECLCPPKVAVCQCGWKRRTTLLTAKPVVPSETEKQANPRSRSAKLRVVERI